MRPSRNRREPSGRRAVCHLTSVHPRHDVRVLVKECGALREAGYDVHLVVSDGCGDESTASGVRVHDVGARPRSRGTRMVLAPLKVLSRSLKTGCVIYHLHDPELLPVGLVLKALGKRVVYDAHEDVPTQLMGKDWIPQRLRGLLASAVRLTEGVAALAFDAVVGATPGIAERFPAEKTVTVRNYPDLVDVGAAARSWPAYSERPPRLVYVGSVTETRGIIQMVRAVGRVDPCLDVQLVVAGTIEPSPLIEKVRSEPGSENVAFRGMLQRPEVSDLLGSARVGLSVLHPLPNYVESPYSVKLFEYMAAGLPVVVSDFVPWRAFLEPIGCALFVDPLSPDEIAGAVEWLLRNPAEAEGMGRRGQRAVAERFNWGVERVALLEMYGRLSA